MNDVVNTFTAAFTGQLGTLGIWRFRPPFRVEKGRQYQVRIAPNGAARLELVPEKTLDAEPA